MRAAGGGAEIREAGGEQEAGGGAGVPEAGGGQEAGAGWLGGL